MSPRRRNRLTAAPLLLQASAPASPATVPRRSARERGYSSRWDRESRRFLADNPLCRGCQAEGLIEPATLTDHVFPHRGDQAQFWNRRMWQASCEWHHNAVKQALERMFDAAEIGVDELWLDSATATAIARRLRSDPGGGA